MQEIYGMYATNRYCLQMPSINRLIYVKVIRRSDHHTVCLLFAGMVFLSQIIHAVRMHRVENTRVALSAPIGLQVMLTGGIQ